MEIFELDSLVTTRKPSMMHYIVLVRGGNPGRINEMLDIKEAKSSSSKDVSDLLEIDVSKISSPALARLVEEVRNDEPPSTRAYHRTYHRHNR